MITKEIKFTVAKISGLNNEKKNNSIMNHIEQRPITVEH